MANFFQQALDTFKQVPQRIGEGIAEFQSGLDQHKQRVAEINRSQREFTTNYAQGVQNINQKLRGEITPLSKLSVTPTSIPVRVRPTVTPNATRIPTRTPTPSRVRISTPTPTPTLTEEQFFHAVKKINPNIPATSIITEYRKAHPTATPTPTPMPLLSGKLSPTIFRFQSAIDQATKNTGVSLEQYHLLRAGENQAENPDAINYNSDGTIDIGLYQINVDPKNHVEVERLKDPLYNAMKAGQIFSQRLNILKDPILAIASYNLGAGGAVLRPMDALKRAQWVYWKAGLEMPQTEFTKDPLGYVRKNMDYYRKLGLFVS